MHRAPPPHGYEAGAYPHHPGAPVYPMAPADSPPVHQMKQVSVYPMPPQQYHQQQPQQMQQHHTPHHQHHHAEGGVVDGEVVSMFPDNPELRNVVVSSGYKDVWATVLFLINFIAAIVVGAMNIANGNLSSSSTSSTSMPSNRTSATEIAVNQALDNFRNGALLGLGIASVFMSICVGIMKCSPAAYIWTALIFFLLVWLGLSILGFAIGAIGLGIIAGLIFLISCAWVYCIRSRIPLAAYLLRQCIETTTTFYGTYLTAAGVTLVVIGWYVLWTCMSIPALRSAYSATTGASSGQMWLEIVFVFMLIFTVKVAEAVVAVTTGGVVGVRYYLSTPDTIPYNATSASLIRALTTSFGSCCFGGLVLAVITTLEYLARTLMRRGGGCCACIMHFILSCLRRIADVLSRFAYAHIALYGDDFVTASRNTIGFLRKSCFNAITNELIIERVLMLTTIIVMVASAVVCYFAFDSFFALFGGLLSALVVCNVVLTVLQSGITTFMVCIATTPDLFVRFDPVGWRELQTSIEEARDGGCSGEGDGAGDSGF